MDFFERQDRSRKNTRRLVIFFFLAVVAIVAAVYTALRLILFLALHDSGSAAAPSYAPSSFWDPSFFGATAGATLLLIALGSLYKTHALSKGGRTVPEMFGAVPVAVTTSDPDERKLRNVVEEMSIASGIPVPQLFVLREEPAINAFAAGFSLGDATIGVTSGTLKHLTRDELQGVIAHEFSHVVNGDMRLNLRLMGLLHGILLIGLTGYWLLRSVRGGRKGSAPLLLLGLAFLLIGYVGVLFGRLIQAAVCRQREFLADASAVQFTRNPDGIGGALKKIAGTGFGSQIANRHAGEIAHMAFGAPFSTFVSRLLATHPPIRDRIRAIDPSFRGTVPEPREGTSDPRIRTDALLSAVGTLGSANLAEAASFLRSLPSPVHSMLQDPVGARALVYALLSSSNEADSASGVLLRRRDPEAAEKARFLREELLVTESRNRLGLLNLAIPALRSLPRPSLLAFRDTVEELIRSDGATTLFEFAIVKLLARRLNVKNGKPDRGKVRFRYLDPLIGDAVVLLSFLAHEGADRTEHIEASFRKGARRLSRGSLRPLPRAECDVTSLYRSLERLAGAAPLLKRDLLEAAAATIGSDGRVSPHEAELLRTVGEILDAPVPPPLSL